MAVGATSENMRFLLSPASRVRPFGTSALHSRRCVRKRRALRRTSETKERYLTAHQRSDCTGRQPRDELLPVRHQNVLSAEAVLTGASFG